MSKLKYVKQFHNVEFIPASLIHTLQMRRFSSEHGEELNAVPQCCNMIYKICNEYLTRWW